MFFYQTSDKLSYVDLPVATVDACRSTHVVRVEI